MAMILLLNGGFGFYPVNSDKDLWRWTYILVMDGVDSA
jgi:hypothetical protein